MLFFIPNECLTLQTLPLSLIATRNGSCERITDLAKIKPNGSFDVVKLRDKLWKFTIRLRRELQKKKMNMFMGCVEDYLVIAPELRLVEGVLNANTEIPQIIKRQSARRILVSHRKLPQEFAFGLVNGVNKQWGFPFGVIEKSVVSHFSQKYRTREISYSVWNNKDGIRQNIQLNGGRPVKAARWIGDANRDPGSLPMVLPENPATRGFISVFDLRYFKPIFPAYNTVLEQSNINLEKSVVWNQKTPFLSVFGEIPILGVFNQKKLTKKIEKAVESGVSIGNIQIEISAEGLKHHMGNPGNIIQSKIDAIPEIRILSLVFDEYKRSSKRKSIHSPLRELQSLKYWPTIKCI